MTVTLPTPNRIEGVDAPAGVATSYNLATGDLFQGSLSSASDSDWVRLDLMAGQSYVFNLWGTGGGQIIGNGPTYAVPAY